MTEFWKGLEGQIIDGTYELKQYLGGNESSGVFRTEHDDRRAAIKLVAADSEEVRRRQLEYWDQAAPHKHSNLIEIFATGESFAGGRPVVYLVCEHSDDDLSQVIRERALEADEARDVVNAAVAALGFLQRKDLVHGRLKPSNVLAVGERVKLSSDSIVHAGEMPLVPAEPDAYTPPEGRSHGITAAGDVWALGIMSYEMLTGRRPANPARFTNRELAPLDPELREVIVRSLHSDPEQRWTAGQIANHLRAPAAGGTEEREVFSGVSESGSWNWRYVAIPLALVLIVAAIALVRRDPAPEPVQRATEGVRSRTEDSERAVFSPQPRPSPFESKEEELSRKEAGTGSWRVIVYSYRYPEAAERQVEKINQKWPRINAEVFSPGGDMHFITIGGNLSREEARELERKAKSMGLPKDTYARVFNP
ncbi:MAG: protein kinase domain-containing protein [Bryobacteraceae bacterium]